MSDEPVPSALPSPAPLPVAGPSTTDRERAIEQLSRHFADDGIELEEFERRAEAVYRATTRAELQMLVSDVPSVIAAAQATVTNAPHDLQVPARDRITAVMSNSERNNIGKVARHVDVRSIMGNVEMNLSTSLFAPGITVFNVKVIMGNVELVFPEHVRVEYHGSSFLASVETIPGDNSAKTNAECVVHVTGRVIMGNVSLMNASGAARLTGDSD